MVKFNPKALLIKEEVRQHKDHIKDEQTQMARKKTEEEKEHHRLRIKHLRSELDTHYEGLRRT